MKDKTYDFPRPWKLSGEDNRIVDANGRTVCVISSGEVDGAYSAESMMNVARQICDTDLEDSDLPGWNWNNVGKKAVELKIPLGRIACPHCGVQGSGMVSPICSMCDRPIFELMVNTDKYKEALAKLLDESSLSGEEVEELNKKIQELNRAHLS